MQTEEENKRGALAGLTTREALRTHPFYKLLLGIGIVALEVLMFPHAETVEFNYRPGMVWADNDLTAAFSFPVYKELRQYEKERQEAVRSVYPVFERRDDVARMQLSACRSLFQVIGEAAAARSRMDVTGRRSDSAAFSERAGRLPLTPSDADWEILGKVATPRTLSRVSKSASELLDRLYRKGIIDQPKSKLSRQQLALRRGALENILGLDQLVDQDEASSQLSTAIVATLSADALGDLALRLSRILVRPNVLFDRGATTTSIDIAQDNVPRTAGYVQENDRIIRKNDLITDSLKLKLDSYVRAKAERGTASDEWKHRLGILFHVSLILGLFTIYLLLFRKRIFGDNEKLLLIALIFLMESFFAYLSLAVDLAVPAQYLILVPAASMLLTIIFDSRVAFHGTVMLAFLIAGLRGNDYAIGLTSVVAGALGAYTVRDIRNRTQIFRSMVFIFSGYAIAMTAFSLEQFEGFRTIFTMLAFAAANAVFSPVLTYGLLILFERTFKITTDLTLAELTDSNHPLLQRLSAEAPGTFHHSMTIGSLAEAAAEAIGANTILAKAGAYFHDVGKILKPEYFVENQVGTQSRHGRLRPRMSALIIQSHVKEGVELARQYSLPESIIAFIPQHHGTTRISFFYDKAVKQASKKAGKESINESDFRYPGPRPQSRETAIVMLADSVEASTRALTELTPERLEQSIENMIKHRFVEGELDECELTLRDLTRIRDAFLKILLGIHHQRIVYPEQRQAEELGAAPQLSPPTPAAPAEQSVPASAPADAAGHERSPAPGNEPRAEAESA